MYTVRNIVLRSGEEMESLSVLEKIIISITYGIVVGLITVPLSKKLALSRTEDPGQLAPLSKAPLRIAAFALGIAASAGIVFTADAPELLIRNLLLLVPIFSISFVDALVRKIPNPLLLVMIAINLVYIVYVCVSTKSTIQIPKSFIGLFFGALVCYIPSVLKIPMGAGDIKYSAVIGLTVYAMGYFQSMLLMAVFVALFFVYLKISKKGGLKTQIPMGPFLSIGTVVTMCVSFFELIDVNIERLM